MSKPEPIPPPNKKKNVNSDVVLKPRAPRNRIEKIKAMAAQSASPAEAAVAQSMLQVVPGDERDGALELVSLARNALQQANTLTDYKDVLDKAKAIRTYVKQRKMGVETENAAAEVILRAERGIGAMLRDMDLQGGRRFEGKNVLSAEVRSPLKDLGITEWESRTWQPLGAATDDQFEAALVNAVAVEGRLSKAAIERYLPRPQRAAPPVRDMGAGPVQRNVGPAVEGEVIEDYPAFLVEPERIIGEGDPIWRAHFDDAIAALAVLGGHAANGWPRAGDWAVPAERAQDIQTLETALKMGVVFYQKMKDL